MKTPIGLVGTLLLCVCQAVGQTEHDWMFERRIFAFAGSGEPGYSGDRGPATSATLREPFHCSFGPRGEMYIADMANHAIRRVDSDGTIRTVAGSGQKGYSGDGGPADKARLNEPYGVVCDRRGNLYIADRLNACIRRVDGRSKVITTLAGTGIPGFTGDDGPASLAQLREPNGLALDRTGDKIYIADVADCRIRVVDMKSGKIATFAGTGKRAFTGDGGPAAQASIYGARAVAVHPDGTVYICEREGNRIRKVETKSGIISTIAGTGSAGFSSDSVQAPQATFRGPKWIALDEAGRLYVVDTENHVIREINPGTGRITTIAGFGVPGRGGDGRLAVTSELNRPHGCCVRNGIVYIADSNNHRIWAVKRTERSQSN